MIKTIKKQPSRRDFVKTSSLATGGLLVFPSMMRGISKPRSNSLLKLALVGCGGRGSGAAVQALNADPNVKLVAMADAFKDKVQESLKAIKDNFDGEKTIDLPNENQFAGFDAYKKAIDLADVVILTTPPGFRPAHFEYAIKKNKHVFMEKPLATDSDGVRRVLKSGKQALDKKLNVVVGLQRHYQNKYIDIFSKIKDGIIGQITGGQVYWNSSGVWVRNRQEGQTELEYQMRNWYYFNWLCGDHIVEQHIHNIDVANWYLEQYPVSAQGMGGRQVRNGKEHGEIYDHHFVEYTYPSGAVISSQCRHMPGCMNRVDEFFQGTKGTVELGKGIVRDLNGNVLYQFQDEEPNPYQVEHDLLFQAIRNGDLINDVENGAMSTMSAIIGRMATYSGNIIELQKSLSLDYKIVPDDLNWDSPAPVNPDKQGNYAIPTPGITSYL